MRLRLRILITVIILSLSIVTYGQNRERRQSVPELNDIVRIDTNFIDSIYNQISSESNNFIPVTPEIIEWVKVVPESKVFVGGQREVENTDVVYIMYYVKSDNVLMNDLTISLVGVDLSTDEVVGAHIIGRKTYFMDSITTYKTSIIFNNRIELSDGKIFEISNEGKLVIKNKPEAVDFLVGLDEINDMPFVYTINKDSLDVTQGVPYEKEFTPLYFLSDFSQGERDEVTLLYQRKINLFDKPTVLINVVYLPRKELYYLVSSYSDLKNKEVMLLSTFKSNKEWLIEFVYFSDRVEIKYKNRLPGQEAYLVRKVVY